MKPFAALVACGAVLSGAAWWLGGRGAAVGGAAAVMAQLVAIALLRPAMGGSQPAFLRRWFAGIAIRAGVLAVLVSLAATHRDDLPLLQTSLGFLGVLLPLLFLETRFLK